MTVEREHRHHPGGAPDGGEGGRHVGGRGRVVGHVLKYLPGIGRRGLAPPIAGHAAALVDRQGNL
jgi:hypothetical protein